MQQLFKLSYARNNSFFFFIPGQGEFVVSDIPAGDGKIANIFLQCIEEQNNILFTQAVILHSSLAFSAHLSFPVMFLNLCLSFYLIMLY